MSNKTQQSAVIADEIVEAELVSGNRVEWNENAGIIRVDVQESLEKLPVGTPCSACGAPREGSARYCVACGAHFEESNEPVVVQGLSGSHRTALPDRVMKCKGCGAEVATSIDARSYVCPFCDTAVVIELPLSADRPRPEFVIGFAVTADDAKEKFIQWLGKNAWYRPGDLAQASIAEKQRGVYLPFWHFSMFAQSGWSANVGEHWLRTETYITKDSQGRTVTRTRTVQETEWFPLSGEHHRYYYGFLVSGTRGITMQEARAIQPYQLSALQRYRPHFLAGWMAEEASIDRQSAAQQTMDEFRQRQIQEIGYFLPGDTSSNLAVATDIDVNDSDLILLPVHVLSYRYKDKVYRFLVNGQTGKTIGEKPWSGKRVVAMVVGAILVFILLALLLLWLAS